MAYTAGKLSLLSQGGTHRRYVYDAQSDSMATVAAAGYFNNDDDSLKLISEDTILCLCSDGDMELRFASEGTAGAITTQMMTQAFGPWNGVIGSASAAISVGLTEIGTGTGTAFTLPTPYIGALVTLMQTGTATGGRTVAVSSSGVTLSAAGLTTLTLLGQGENAQLLGISATRWVLTNAYMATALS